MSGRVGGVIAAELRVEATKLRGEVASLDGSERGTEAEALLAEIDGALQSGDAATIAALTYRIRLQLLRMRNAKLARLYSGVGDDGQSESIAAVVDDRLRQLIAELADIAEFAFAPRPQ